MDEKDLMNWSGDSAENGAEMSVIVNNPFDLVDQQVNFLQFFGFFGSKFPYIFSSSSARQKRMQKCLLKYLLDAAKMEQCRLMLGN